MSDGMAATPSMNTDTSLIRALSRPGTLVRILAVFIAAKIVFLTALALNSAFVMDEYWTVVHGLFGLDHLYRDIWPAKTVLYAPVFRLPHLLGEGAVEIMLVARALMSAVAIGALWLLYLVARQIGRSRLEAAFIVALVLSFRSQIEWAFLARPEPLALLYAMAALWLATRGRGGLGLCLAAGLVSGIAFLTLQKAAYFNLALGLALVGDGLARRAWKDAVASGAALVLGWGLVVGAYYLIFMALGADLGRMLGYSLAGPALQNALVGYQAYGDGLRSFLLRMVGNDLLLYLLCAAGLIMSGSRLGRMASPERRAWIFSVVIAILVFSHRAPWPYNFILAVPFLGLWGAVPFRAMPAARRVPRLAAVCLLVGALSFFYNIRYLGHDNAFQNQTVRRAEGLLQPDDRYFDGIGMVVDRQQAGGSLPGQVASWDQLTISMIRAAAEQGDLDHFERIFGGAPKVWILSYRTLALDDLLTPYLERSFVPIYPNILIAGVELLPGDAATFRNRWPGTYRLYRSDGTPAAAGLEIDGRRVEGPLRLERARYAVRLADGSEPLYLLPADIEGVPFDMTAPREQQALFPQTYTY
jgi:hypothetical protein